MFLRDEEEEEDGGVEVGCDPPLSLLLLQPSSPSWWPYVSEFGSKDKEFNFTGVSSPAPFSPLWNFSGDHHNYPIPVPDNYKKNNFSVLCNPIAVRDLSFVFTHNPPSSTIEFSIAVEVVSKYVLNELDIIWNKKSHNRNSTNIVSNLSTILSRRVLASGIKECSISPVLQLENEPNLCIQNKLPFSIEPIEVVHSAESSVAASVSAEPEAAVEQVPGFSQTDCSSLNQPPEVLVLQDATSVSLKEKCTCGAIAKIDSQGPHNGYEVQGITTVILNKGNISSSKCATSESVITLEDLQQRFSMTREEAAKSFGVSVSTLKRVCRKHGISRWPFRKRRKNESPSELKSISVTEQDIVAAGSIQTDLHAVNPVQEVRFVTVKAKYIDKMIRFDLPYLSEMVELEDQVAKRLKLEVGSFSIEYVDEDDDQILLTSSEDLRYCIASWTSLGKTTIRMLVKFTTS